MSQPQHVSQLVQKEFVQIGPRVVIKASLVNIDYVEILILGK